VFDLSPGDVVRIGDGITLTVLAIEDDLVRFGAGVTGPVMPSTALSTVGGCPGNAGHAKDRFGCIGARTTHMTVRRTA
jgi:hypothetical protein